MIDHTGISQNYDCEAAPFIEAFSAKYEAFSKEYSLARWDFYTTGKDPGLDKFVEQESEMLSDPELYTNLEKWKGHLSDPILARQVKKLYKTAKKYHFDKDRIEAIEKKKNEVNEIHMNCRAIYQGKEATDSELRKVICEETDVALREEAWKAAKIKGDLVAPGNIELVKMRNAYAQSQGHNNYFEMRLKDQDIDPQRLYSLLDKLDAVSEAPYTKIRNEKKAELAKFFNISAEDLKPWHFGYDIDNFTQDIDAYFPKEKQVAILKQSFKAMGFDLDQMGIVFDLEQREGKTQHGFCFGIDIPNDVRIIANEEAKHDFQYVLQHEGGHAVYYKGIDASLPFLLRNYASSVMTEGVAELFGMIVSNDANWLQTYADMPQELAEKNESKNREAGQSFIRSYLQYINFEKELYENPDQDLAGLWWDLGEKYKQTPKPDDTSLNGWAEVIHFTGYPAYLQNYLLAEIVACQLFNTIEKENGSVIGNPKTAEFLNKELFVRGATIGEKDLLIEVTGEEMNPQHYVDYVFGENKEEK